VEIYVNPQIAEVTPQETLSGVTNTGVFSVAAASLEGPGLTMVFQPIVELRTWVLGGGGIVGYEALARFEAGHGPDEVFAAANAAGFGIDLETKALKAALESLSLLPSGTFLSINVSPQLVASGRVGEVLSASDAGRVVFDLIGGGDLAWSEADGWVDQLAGSLTELQTMGARIALDDTVEGSGGSIEEFVVLPFDTIKIDRLMIQDVDKHPDRAAGIMALVDLAKTSGADVIAEGIETADELAALINIGVRYGQGYLLGFPAPLEQQAPMAS
jgi:EAL domain-containing protein (putative c-di-GMP-specific phosphodiesterase class I)